MSKIINFNKVVASCINKDNNIITINDSMVRNDEYLYLSLINAIDKAGYEVSPDGILKYQIDHNLRATSKIAYCDFLILIQELGNDNVQEIYNHINRKREIHDLIKLKNQVDEENKDSLYKETIQNIKIAGLLAFVFISLIMIAIALGTIIFPKVGY